MNPALALAIISLTEMLITKGPKALKDTLDAWQKVDPTFEDFDALAALAAQKKLDKEVG